MDWEQQASRLHIQEGKEHPAAGSPLPCTFEEPACEIFLPSLPGRRWLHGKRRMAAGGTDGLTYCRNPSRCQVRLNIFQDEIRRLQGARSKKNPFFVPNYGTTRNQVPLSHASKTQTFFLPQLIIQKINTKTTQPLFKFEFEFFGFSFFIYLFENIHEIIRPKMK